MSNTNERPTPETDAACWMQDDCEIINSNFARRLERERDEAREKLDAVSKRAERIRCELVQAETSRVTNAALYERALKERDEERETLRNAEAELSIAVAERDDFRRQIQSSSINTNVRLFDLVRHQRAALHEDELITDEEYAWLCGSEMAMSPQGGSPSPRRLEDYDHMREQLEAMRSAIKEAHDEMHELMMAPWANLPGRANDMIESVVNKLQPFLKP